MGNQGKGHYVAIYWCFEPKKSTQFFYRTILCLQCKCAISPVYKTRLEEGTTLCYSLFFDQADPLKSDFAALCFPCSLVKWYFPR